MSLIWRSTTEVTSATSAVTITGVNTTNVFVIYYSGVFMTNDGASMAMRITSSGSAVSTSNYSNARLNMYANQTTYFASNSSINYMPNLSQGTTATECQNGILTLHNFQDSNNYSSVIMNLSGATETPEYIGSHGSFALETTSACDGMYFYPNSGTIAGGKWVLYEYV